MFPPRCIIYIAITTLRHWPFPGDLEDDVEEEREAYKQAVLTGNFRDDWLREDGVNLSEEGMKQTHWVKYLKAYSPY